MPTNDERREVARNLRGGKYSRHSWERSLYDAIGEDLETSGSDMLYRLADLIDPDPERTCRNIDGFCSECGEQLDDGICQYNYCAYCGAKVVDDRWFDEPTEKQLALIEDIDDHMGRLAPKFIGSTRREAAEYINRYLKLANGLAGVEFESQQSDWGDRGD